jgi:thiamine pyrophosphokinase
VDDVKQTDGRTFTVLLAGSVTPTPRLRAEVQGSRVIAADGGIVHAAALGVTPELWIGDFDSTADADADRFAHIPKEPYPAAKNATDGALALEAALERGARSVTLVGAFGGRTDHAFAIMAAAAALGRSGLAIRLTDGREEAVPLGSRVQSFAYPKGTIFSVLAFGHLEGLTLTGARWPLDAVSVPFGDSLTVSNEVAGDLTAQLAGGTALLLAQLAD